MKKAIIIIISLVLIGFVGKCLYKVACISCTPSAIKKYEYSGGINQIELKFKKFAMLNSDVNLKISYRDSSDKTNESARDMMIELKNNSKDVVYHIAYIQRKPDKFTSVYLDDVYDKIHKSGGNDIDSSSVKSIFDDFKENFLPRLEKADIILKPQFFYLY